MKKLFIILLYLICTKANALSFEDSTAAKFEWPKKKPKFFIHITTTDNRKVKGMLVGLTDSTVALFPGKPEDWKHREKYQPLYFADTSIAIIKTKNKNAIGTGALSGLLLGAMPLLAGASGNQDMESMVYVSALTIPAGVLVGTFTGAAFGQTFKVYGSHEKFLEFSNRFKYKP